MVRLQIEMNENRITHYATVADEGLDGLEAKVNESIGRGWQPLGGVSVVLQFTNRLYYVQALAFYGGAAENPTLPEG